MYEVLYPQQLNHIKDSNALLFTYKILCKEIYYRRAFEYNEGYYVPVSWCRINNCWFINWKNKKVYEHSSHRNSNLIKALNDSEAFNKEMKMMNFKINSDRSLLFIDINNENKVYSLLGVYKKNSLGKNILVEISNGLEAKIIKDIASVRKNTYICIEERYNSFFKSMKNYIIQKEHFISLENEKVSLDLSKLSVKDKNYNFHINKKVFREGSSKKNYFYKNKDNINISYMCFLMSDFISKHIGCNIVINHKDKNCLIQIKSVAKKEVLEFSEEKEYFNYLPESF